MIDWLITIYFSGMVIYLIAALAVVFSSRESEFEMNWRQFGFYMIGWFVPVGKVTWEWLQQKWGEYS